jgi:Protein of unknown function (DUF3551)
MARILVIATVVGVAMIFLPQGGARAAGKWCAYYEFSATNCGFETYEQCHEAISGNGGDCSQIQ